MRKTLDRSFYIPKNSKETKNGDAVVYTYSMDKDPIAMGFYGKTKKPVFHYRFKSPERMQQYIDKFFADRKQHFVRKAEAKAKTKARLNWSKLKSELQQAQTGAVSFKRYED